MIMAGLAILIIIFGGYAITGNLVGPPKEIPPGITTFRDTGSDACAIDGRPVVRLFSTTTCPHCRWVKDMFDRVAKEYADAGLIVAYHWELDTQDNTLTTGLEGAVPESEQQVFNSISQGYVPAYSIGCRYVRVGNGHENEGIEAEEAELRAAIESLTGGTA
jgi:thiol-disulfide isomerase/thioredoxin